MMNFTKNLEILGFSKNEASVYLALIDRGTSRAGDIIKHTDLHRMLVYNALDSLTKRGYITQVKSGKKIMLFQPSDPGILFQHVDKINEIASNIIPQLRELQQQKADIIATQTYIGRDGLIQSINEAVYSSSKDKNKRMDVITGPNSEAFYSAIDDWYKKYSTLLRKNGIKKKMIVEENNHFLKEKFLNESNSTLAVAKRGLTSPVSTRITHEMVSIEIYEPQIVVIQIRNSTIARAYQGFFDVLWGISSVVSKS